MNDDVRIITGLDRLCRTCLSEKNLEELRSLFDNSLETQLSEVTSVKVEENDGLPNNICNDCYLTLNIALNFKDQCQKSESQLRNALYPGQTIIYRSITILGDNSAELNIQDFEEDNSNLPLLKDNEINNEVVLPDSIEIENNLENGETESETIYLKTDNDTVNVDYKINASSNIEFGNIPGETLTECVPVPVIEHTQFEEGLNKVNIKSEELKVETNILYGCDQCSKEFEDKHTLRAHVLKHGEELKCEKCGEQFNSIKFYKKHLKQHSKNGTVCKICGKDFANLTKHMRTHGIGERRHLCTICGKRFYEQNHLTIHMRIHTGEKPYECGVCGKRFSDPHGLPIHNKVHTGEKKHECNVCGKSFAHSFVLKAHKRTHTGEKPYSCHTCGAAFATSSYLKVHNRTHTKEKPYKCENCPMSFVSKCGLIAHNKSHTGEKKFQCAICGKRAGRSADLRTHMRSHSGEKPYACDQCPKRYHTSSNLATHKRTHLGIKDQICPTCGKAFGDPRTLKAHCRIHTGEKPYVCTVCGKAYTQAGQLAGHRKIHVTQILETMC